MNATLTAEQSQALAAAHGEAICLIDPATNEDYVLVKAAVYERLRQFLSEDTVYTTAEMLDRVMVEDDAHDPLLGDLQIRYGGNQP